MPKRKQGSEEHNKYGSTYYRNRKKRYDSNERKRLKLLDEPSQTSASDKANRLFEDYQISDFEDHRSVSNQRADFEESAGDPFQHETDKSNLSGCPAVETNVSNRDHPDQSSDADLLLFANELVKLKLEDSVAKNTISKILKLVNTLAKSKFGEHLVPSSYNAIVKVLDLKEDKFKTHIGFVCQSCKHNVRMLKKDLERCPFCEAKLDRRAINNDDHFWHFDLETQLEALLESKDLSPRTADEESDLIRSVFDGVIFEQYQLNRTSPTDRLILLTLFSDGVRVSRSSNSEVWPIYLKVNDLNCSQEEKTYLYASFHGSCKPDPEFFLEGLLDSLIKLSRDGILVSKLGFKVYPMLAINLFDTPARSLFMAHASHTGYFACTVCQIRGERKRSCQLFKPQEIAGLGNRQTYEQALEQELPHKGVAGVCPFARLPYYPIYRAEPPDVMHAVMGGLAKRMLSAMFQNDYKDRPCFMKKKLRNVLSRRIGRFGRHSEFKRMPRDLNSVEHWKTNEFFQWFFYIAPICLKGLVSAECYNNYILFVYIISSLWSNVLKESLAFLEQLIDLFLSDLEPIYDEFMYVINSHLISHLVLTVRHCGPLNQSNAFFFEHLNFNIKKYVKSNFSLNDQIRTDSIVQFHLNLRKPPNQPFPQALGVYHRANVKHFKKIRIKRVKFTSSEFDHKKKCADFFVRTTSLDFYLVCRYFERDSIVYFEGLKIANLGNLKFNYKLCNHVHKLKLDYIYKVEITDRSCTLPISSISKKLHFVPQFKDKHSKFEYQRKGFLIDCKHKAHN